MNRATCSSIILLRAPSSLTMDVSKGGTSITSLGHLCQCFTLITKNFLFISSLNLLCFSFTTPLKGCSGTGMGCPERWWSHRAWWCSKSIWMLCWGTWLSENHWWRASEWLDWMILWVFSNLSDSMILWLWSFSTPRPFYDFMIRYSVIAYGVRETPGFIICLS